MALKTNWKMQARIFAGIVLLGIVIAAFTMFERAINATVSESSTNFLKETAFLYAGTFKVKLNDQLFMLESQARYFSGVDMDDYNKIKQTIMQTKGVGEFKRIAVANSSGMTINYDGKSSGNILMKDYFKKAMQGMSSISSKISIDEDGERVLTLAVPIYQNGNVKGVITGTFSYSILGNILSVDTFDGQGYSFVIDSDGAILIGNNSPNRLCYSENWFDFLKFYRVFDDDYIAAIQRDIRAKRTDVISYSVNRHNRVMVYTPVSVNDWYVLSVVTSDYILAQQRKITFITLAVIAVTIAVFVILMVILAQLLVRKNQIEKENVRYTITSESSQTLIFEYDFERQVIEFTGNTESIFGQTVKKLPLDDFSIIESRIHEAERGLLGHLREFMHSGNTNYTSELRVKSKDGDYLWYRITGTVILDREDRPLKFIGNVVNVNAQVVHEQELKTQAETDLLSGLLNKTYMEKNVAKFISKNADAACGALYIIDLDNFKQVNDKLGHSFGDTAICDTANKLSLVFSEKDFIGRIGGDEFCVFLCLRNSGSMGDARKIIEEKATTLISLLAGDYSNGEYTVHVTPSVGIALFPVQATSYKDLFKRADVALYHVKNHGKNNFAVFDISMKNAGESVYE